MSNTELCKEAHKMMVEQDWKILTSDGMKIPELEDVERSARWILHRMSLEKNGVMKTGCFKVTWNRELGKGELEIVKKESLNDE